MSRLLTRARLVIGVVICVAVGSLIAWSSFAGPTSAPAYVTRADFDQAFADAAAGHRDFKPTDRERLRDAGWHLINTP
jgi:hypothetical protein